MPQNLRRDPLGRTFTKLLRQKALHADGQLHWKSTPNECIFRLSAATKGRINEEAYSCVTGVPIDRQKVGSHRGDFPNKTQAKLSCIKSDGKFIINHLTKDDEFFLITCVEPWRITLLRFTRSQLWDLMPTRQNGSGDYILVASLEALLAVGSEILEQHIVSQNE